MIKKILLCFAVIFAAASFAQDRTTHLRDLLYNSNNYCLVVSHRGDWRNAPENSLRAFQNCIDMGVDMIELDLKMTKDSVLVLFHDPLIDRTCTGKGKPSDYTWEELRKFKLKSGHNVATRHNIATLEETLQLCKGKILINIDKGYDYFQEVFSLLEKTGTLDQVVIKSNHVLKKIQEENPGVLDKVIYMPIVNLDRSGAEQMIDEFATIKPVAIECCFKEYTPEVERLLQKVKSYGCKIWLNSLWASLSAGHDDDMAVEENRPEDSWGWLIQHGALIMQTDRPKELIEYLKYHQLHE
jgi:glycerophosphoryl diester phosphodiesterase